MLCLDDCTDECLFTVVLACLGFLSPANRGALMTCAVVLWVLLGTPAGYVSARLYKSKSPVMTFNRWSPYIQDKKNSVILTMKFSFFLFSAFGGEKWKTNVLLTALLCPGYVYSSYLFICYSLVSVALQLCP